MQLLNTSSTSYTKIRDLGAGSFGEVFLVRNEKSGELVVSKEMRLNGLDELTTIQLYTEVKVLETIKHPNIIEMYETYRTKSNKLVLILEYASNGDLLEFIKNRNGDFIDEGLIRLWTIQLCLALKHSHDHRVVHRDLKTSNVFLDGDNNIKLGDFGLAKNLDTSRQHGTGIAGTPLYLSPETITKGIVSFRGDVWSLGVILHELCSLKNPFLTTNYGSLMNKICREPIPPLNSIYSEELKAFIMSLLERDDKKRPSMQELFQTDFLQDILIKNQFELKKLIRTSTQAHNRASDQGLKKDHAIIKFFKPLGGVKPVTMARGLENIANKQQKLSKFSSNKIIISSSGSQVDNKAFEDHDSHKANKENNPDEKKTDTIKSEISNRRISPVLTPSSSECDQRTPKKQIEEGFLDTGQTQFIIEPIAEENSVSDHHDCEDQRISFYNSIMKSVIERDTRNSLGPKTTIDTKAKDSGLLLDENKRHVWNMFDDRNINDSGLDKYGPESESNDKEWYKSCKDDQYSSVDVDLEDGLSAVSGNISYNYSCSKNMDSARNSNMLFTYDSNTLEDRQTSPRSPLDQRNGKHKKIVFVQYKNSGIMDRPQTNKFKISAKDQLIKLKTPQHSTEFEANKINTAKNMITPVKSNKKDALTKLRIENLSKFQTEKKSSEFKLKLKGTLSGIKPIRQKKIKLQSLGELPCENQLKQTLSSKKPVLIKINSKCNTINSLNNLNSLANALGKVNLIADSIPGQSKYKYKKQDTTSIGNFTSKVDEYDLPVGLHKNLKLQFDSIRHGSLEYGKTRNLATSTSFDDVERSKAVLMEKYGERFQFIYSTARKFLLSYGLRTIEEVINDEARLLKMLDEFTSGSLELAERNIALELVQISFAEIKNELL